MVLFGYMEGDIIIYVMEFMVKEGEFVNDRELIFYFNFVDVFVGEKRRMVVMVCILGNSGYYVDIFWLDRVDNDYLFYYVGILMEIIDLEGNKFFGEVLEKFDKMWYEGYYWFFNLYKFDYNQNFIVLWSMFEDIMVCLWMIGGEGCEIYQVDVFSIIMNKGLIFGDICMFFMLIFVLIVCQEGNNVYIYFFVFVYEVYKKSGLNVFGVEVLQGDDGCIGVKVNMVDGYVDYLFSVMDMQVYYFFKCVLFCGGLGLIREKEGQI